jgi:urease alpha subunit
VRSDGYRERTIHQFFRVSGDGDHQKMDGMESHVMQTPEKPNILPGTASPTIPNIKVSRKDLTNWIPLKFRALH